MNVLVVGGAGYVGGAVTDLLAAPNYVDGVNFAGATKHQFLVYDSLLYEDSYRKPVPFVRGDIRDRERLLPYLQWADAVIWLAALVGDAACALDSAAAVEVNQESVRWLAEVFPRRIIFLSTCSVYGAADSELDESSPTSPLSVYATTKLAAEQALAAFHPNFIAFRLGTLFGLSDNFSRVRFDLVVNALTLRAQTTGQITVFGGEQYRPLLHVRDAAGAVVRALDQSATGIYNLHRSNRQIADLADQVAGEFSSVVVDRTSQHFEDNRNYRVNSDKARMELEFRPQASVPFGVREIKALLEERRISNPDSPRYRNHEHLAGKGVAR